MEDLYYLAALFKSAELSQTKVQDVVTNSTAMVKITQKQLMLIRHVLGLFLTALIEIDIISS